MDRRSRSVLCAECFSSPARAGSLLPRRHLLVSPVARGTTDRPLGSPCGLLLHPLAMRLILGIDPDSHLQGGWQSASERLKMLDGSGARSRFRVKATSRCAIGGDQAWAHQPLELVVERVQIRHACQLRCSLLRRHELFELVALQMAALPTPALVPEHEHSPQCHGRPTDAASPRRG